MKKLLQAVSVLLFLFSLTAQASEFAELKKKVGDARSSLIAMMLHKDQRDAKQQKLVKDTADAVSEMLAKLKAPPGKEAQFKEFSETWAAFKKTRETELVPAILKGKDDEANNIASGIQKERYKRMQELLLELDM